MYNFARITIFFCILSILTVSCTAMATVPAVGLPKDMVRVLPYVHVENPSPFELEFTVISMVLASGERESAELLHAPMVLNSGSLIGAQAFLGEGFVEAGSYDSLRMKLSWPKLKKGSGEVELTPVRGDGYVILPLKVSLGRGESVVVNIELDPLASIESNNRFRPSFSAIAKGAHASDMLAFVTNSRSDYVSVIDMTSNRVVSAVTVGQAPTAMALNATKDTLFVLNSKDNTISLIEISSLRAVETIELMIGFSPFEMAFSPESEFSSEGKLYVLYSISEEVAVVDTAVRRVQERFSVAQKPSDIAVDDSRDSIYVTSEVTNNLIVMNSRDFRVTRTVSVGGRPMGMVVNTDKIYVLNEGSGTISIVSLPELKADVTVSSNKPEFRGALSDEGHLVTISRLSGYSFIYDADGTISTELMVGKTPMGLALDDVLKRAYITASGDDSLTVIAFIDEMVLAKIPVGPAPYEVVLLNRLKR